MEKYLKEIEKAYKKAKEIEKKQDALTAEIEKLLEAPTLKGRIENRRSNAGALDEIAKSCEKLKEAKEENILYLQALKKHLVLTAEKKYIKNLLDNRKKLEGVPVRYEKVKKCIPSELENLCHLCITSYGAPTFHINANAPQFIKYFNYEEATFYLNITKSNDNCETVLDFEKIADQVENGPTPATPDEIKKAAKNHYKAQKKIDQEREKAKKKIEELKNNNSFYGLNFDAKQIYL